MNDAWFRFAEEETTMPASWRAPLNTYQQGWGFHRMRMVIPDYVRARPPMSAMDVPTTTSLTFFFRNPISFADTQGKTIRLYEAANVRNPIWQSDLTPGHPAEGEKQITFAELPPLKPNTTYFALADPGWIRVGGKPAGTLNDGAYWYRFRTGEK